MWKTRILALLVFVAGLGIGYFNYTSQVNPTSEAYRPFKLGLDLSGGTHLVYRADVSSLPANEVKDAMATLRDVIERRVNLFGVAEPIVQTERAGAFAGGADEGTYRLIVELPGVTDVESATALIGSTPVLEFMTRKPNADLDAYNKKINDYVSRNEVPDPSIVDTIYDKTGLTGRFLEKATLAFSQTTNEPYVLLTFNKEGKDLFAQITKENIGKPVAIFLDRHLGNIAPITEPTVREEITGGEAQITGNFTAQEAKTLVGRLNSGALPVDQLTLISTQTIGPALGAQAINSGIRAGLYGLLFVAVFLILWYRLSGVLAVLSLGLYIVIMLALFKFIPVTLTAAGIAGFILSIGMAVDANVLIFERMKEELRAGKRVRESITEGFKRAWLSIRDGNVSSIITAIILFWFGTSLIEGFALVFGLGIIVSMFSAITISRTFLRAVAWEGSFARKMFGSGIK